MTALIQALQEQPTLLLTSLPLVSLLIAFVVWFLIPAVRLRRTLTDVRRSLHALKDSDSESLRAVFVADDRLGTLWKDYEESLHKELQERDGILEVAGRRSTIAADAYFNSQFVVDSPLHTEFFRHLPGVFTGIGIIGTFGGLIYGLGEFGKGFKGGTVGGQIDATVIQDAVVSLLAAVSGAFYISAAAITSAMVVTVIEKFLIARLYKLTEDIAQNIDARFDGSVGESYLQRMAVASEESSTQLKVLKDALVNDLSRVLSELSSTQMNAAQVHSRDLAASIARSINDGLSEPMKSIAGTVQAASGDQSAAAARMLQDVMVSFSERLNTLFGGQITGINDLNRESAQTMRESVVALNSLVAGIESATASSSDMMAKRMAEALEKMERRQESMNQQTAAFVEQLRSLVATSQSETNRKLQEVLSELGHQVGGMMGALRASNSETLNLNLDREERLSTAATAAVSTMTGSVEGAVKEISAASVRMQDAVAQIAAVSTASLDKMNYSADALSAASSTFARAGDGVTGAMAQAATVAGRLTELAGALSASSTSLQQAVSDYKGQRDSVAMFVTELRSVVNNAKTEATITADVLSRIEGATTRLVEAQKHADAYLQSVNSVLIEAHRAFADATQKTLERANTGFHDQLALAVNLLSGTIQELDVSLGAK